MQSKNLEARIEILTDGSNKTGGAAIFLTIRRCIPQDLCPNDGEPSQTSGSNHDFYYKESPQDGDDGTILARYNLSGIPSLTGRLSSDQSYKLLQNGAFSAIFVPSLVQSVNCGGGIIRGECVGGFPALFLNLIQAGYKIADNDNNTIATAAEYSSDSGVEGEAKTCSDRLHYNDVSIIGPSGLNETVDGLLDTMFGNIRRRPSLRLCEVPHDNETWYEVYDDVYVRIWAQSRTQNETTTNLSSSDTGEKDINVSEAKYLALIVMLRPQTIESHSKIQQQKEKRQRVSLTPHHLRPYSFAICTRSTSTCQWDAFRNLPQEIMSNGKQSSFLLDFMLHLKPSYSDRLHSRQTSTNVHKAVDKMRVETRTIDVPSWIIDAKLAQRHLAVFPSDPYDVYSDDGLLIRAWYQSKTLHNVLPFAFPLSVQKSVAQQEEVNLSQNEEEEKANMSTVTALKLSSCTSVKLDGWNCSQSNTFTFLSRAVSIRSKCQERCIVNFNETSRKDESSPKSINNFTDMVKSLKCAYSRCRGTEQQNATDDNEIDLDDSSCEDEEQVEDEIAVSSISTVSIDKNSAHLIFLGTGCATPSPHRSSSGIGLFMPTTNGQADCLSLKAIIECGEGTLSSLSRYIQSLSSEQSSLDEHLANVSFIWISHAHLDHYGDISAVVQAVSNAKKKLPKTPPVSPKVVLIAPPKVLKYVRVMLETHGSKHSDRLYLGITHRDFQISPFAGQIRSTIYDVSLLVPGCSRLVYKPFVSMQNVEVEHCRDAYALLLEMSLPTKHGTFDRFSLCFSGDTRPSAMLTQACLMHPNPISLLIHEATFLDDSHGREEALRKKHSTVREALDIAKNMKAEACILTHFSQRYYHVSADDVCSNNSAQLYAGNWGIACDGMLIPLTKRGMNSLLPLTKCVDTILTNHDNVGS